MFTFNERFEFEFMDIKFTLQDFRLQTMTKPYPIHYHGKDTIEIHYLKDGSGKIIIENKEYNVSKGYFFIVNEMVNHTQIPNPKFPMEKYSIYLSFDASKCKSEEIINYLKNATWVGEDKLDCIRYFELIKKEATNKEIGYIQIIEGLLRNLFILIVRNHNKTINRVKTLKNANSIRFDVEKIFLNEYKDITLPELSKRFDISEREMQRYLKSTYNKTFNNLKLEARMNSAANTLIHTDISISEISEMVGYSSVEHFSYAFKNFFNNTPLKYRKSKQKGYEI